ncbi:DUF5333 domain-containing protein [Pseudosulfitobacter sp. DSM 107133]|jgi:hypothetical protein|uniref:DUF5333 domain-containing protein n=1 Tax=Pseudosulfitobacter sp. DSM 107133 TaxID=2883100 RepID=UPI0013B40794|nr:DUF5333 domain-containing protein [Pseudosulfitobacter sp. DSM 107133]UOA27629.1 hypothetical protein DSM107133_02359 [Pseudosulfitobacter sp. DSM 107133]
MRLKTFVLGATLALSAATATSAGAKPHLRDTPIDDGLLAVGLADEIRSGCPDISARMLKALGYLSGLKSQAHAMGYSDAEIDAYRKSGTEKARLKSRGAAYLAANGVVVGQPETYCALGRKEIEKSSQIGSLLRVN